MDDLQAQAVAFQERRGPAAFNSIRVGANSNVVRARQTTTSDVFTEQITVQSVKAGSNSQLQGVEQKAILNLEKRHYWFDLAVQELSGGEAGADFVPLQRTVSPQAGRTYRVRVSLSENAYHQPLRSSEEPGWQLNQYELRILGDLTLGLELQGDTAVVEAIGAPADAEVLFPLNERNSWYHDFTLIIPSDAPSGTLSLVLTYRAVGSATQPYPAAWLTGTLVGATVSKLPRTADLATGVKPPPHTAILHIHPADATQLRLFATTCDNLPGLLALHPIERPPTAPEDYHEEAEYLDAISGITHDYAIYDPGHLGAWFEKVVETYPPDGCIVIDDLTDSRIPWEMFKLRNARYLGTHMLVVRWTAAHYRGLTRELERGEATYQGRVAAYVHPDEEATTKTMFPLLDALASVRCAASTDFQYALFPEAGRPPIGLVYLAYKGLLVYGDEQGAAGGPHTSQGAPVRIRFDDVEALLPLRPLFIVNAPFSGRILRRGQVSCGLAHAALTQVASGLIGTLGPVDREFAAEIAQHFLHAASTQGLWPARLLHNLRVEAARVFQDPNTPASQRAVARRRLLYTFMYIYYGNPEAYVRVLAPGDAAAGATVQEPDHD